MRSVSTKICTMHGRFPPSAFCGRPCPKWRFRCHSASWSPPCSSRVVSGIVAIRLCFTQCEREADCRPNIFDRRSVHPHRTSGASATLSPLRPLLYRQKLNYPESSLRSKNRSCGFSWRSDASFSAVRSSIHTHGRRASPAHHVALVKWRTLTL